MAFESVFAEPLTHLCETHGSAEHNLDVGARRRIFSRFVKRDQLLCYGLNCVLQKKSCAEALTFGNSGCGRVGISGLYRHRQVKMR